MCVTHQLHLLCHIQRVDWLPSRPRLLCDQHAAQHLLCKDWGLSHCHHVHSTLQPAGELAQTTAARKNLALQDNLKMQTSHGFESSLKRCVGRPTPVFTFTQLLRC